MPADSEPDAAYDPDPALTKARGCVKMMAIGALVVVAILFGAGVLFSMNTSSGVQAERELLKAAGAPMTNADLLGPDPAPEENAASDLEAAFVAMTRASGQPYVRDAFPTTYGAAMQAIIDAVKLPLAERLAIYAATLDDPDLQEALVALEAAAAKPHCRFYLAQEVGAEMRLPNLSLTRNASRLLAADALAKAAAGDEEAAWARIRQGLKLAQHFGETPHTLTYMLAGACEGITLTAALEMQPWMQAPMPAWLLAESGHFDIFVDPTLAVAALDGDRIGIESHYFQMTDQLAAEIVNLYAGEEQGIARWYTSYAMKPLRSIDHRTYLSMMRALRETLVSRTFDRDLIKRDGNKGEIPPYCLMSRMMIPYLPSVLNGSLVLKSRLQRLVLVACDYRRRTGAFPADFDALVAALPPDLAAIAKDPAITTPAQPLIYRVDDEGIMLYGYGRDGVDSGGHPSLDVVVTATILVPPPVTPPEPEDALADDERLIWDD